MFIAFSRSLFWKLFLPIGGLLILCGVFAMIFLPLLIRSNAEKEAIAAGQDTLKQFKILRGYYTENVIAKLVAKGDIKPGADHKGNPDKVPLPATMILDLSDLLKPEGTTLKLYSPYPFPNRKDRVLDQFGQDAWTFLHEHPDQMFARSEVIAGTPVMRVAVADKMSAQGCVNCHNSNPTSPKTDWKLNDVRGVLEIDLDKQIASGQRIVTPILGAIFLTIVLIAGFLRYVYQRSIAGPLKYAVDGAQRVAEGDFSKHIDSKSSDEIGSLLTSLQAMQQHLSSTLRLIRDDAASVSAASHQIAAGNAEFSNQTEQQASNLQETASSMEELTSTVKQNTESVNQANRLAAAAHDIAANGGEVVGQVINTMASINESAKKIADITSVIDGIAFQTNILALNAAVEAARAGEQGRGFAVVAAEVRNLAQRSAAAAKEIKAIIGESVEKVDRGSQLAAQSGQTMTDIVASVRRVTDIMNEIANASGEQSSGIEQVSQAIIQIDDATQKNAALVEEIASAAEAMQEKAGNLEKAVQKFNLD
ncbi:MAG TPA: methyl-accepting chemotaxis protein [Burkholderiaceae bacterium]|jgi:methyl-accepting chemotaxis protein|nr:methyl-accepting chemotaxis protein [Burkholderiaceae bacterium]